uniref:Uncharacterized protein n=1 Tax=Romanomermis culicivorax TaxID=13658 RepID=A0A915L554_ROMCU
MTSQPVACGQKRRRVDGRFGAGLGVVEAASKIVDAPNVMRAVDVVQTVQIRLHVGQTFVERIDRH